MNEHHPLRAAMRGCWHHPARRDAVALSTAFAATVLLRLVARERGVVFDAGTLRYAYQLLDMRLLTGDLWSSLWWLHAQPPLMNAFVGVVHQALPGHALAGFAWSYRLFTAILVAGVYMLARVLGAGRAMAAMAAMATGCSPACVYYEHYLFYTHPCAAIIVIAACALAVWSRRDAPAGLALAGGIAFAAAVWALAWTRSVFHPAWFIPALALLPVARPCRLRTGIAIASVAAAATLSLYVKNLVVFGSFSASTWAGMSICKVVTSEVSDEEWARLRETPSWSPLLELEEFEPPGLYAPFLPPATPRGHPAVDAMEKENGTPNMNHSLIADASRAQGQAALRAAPHLAPAILRSLHKSLVIYLKPANEYLYLSALNGPRFWREERALSLLLYGKFGEHTYLKEAGAYTAERRVHQWAHIGWWIPVMLAAAVAWSARRSRALLPGGEPASAAAPVAAFILLTVLWISAIGVVLEIGENNRFRWQIEPLVWAACAAAAQGAVEGVRRMTHP